MNILHLITYYYPYIYGAENFAKNVAEFQAKSHKVSVLTGKWKKEWKALEVVNGVKIERVRVVRIPLVQTILATIPFTLKALKTVENKKIDVIHSHIYPGMMVGYLVKRVNPKIKFVATIQGGDIGDYVEIFGPFKRLARTIIGFCLRRADVVHCVSKYLKNELIKMGVNKSRIVLIPNGVDEKKYKLVRRVFGKGVLKIVSTSSLEEKNNLVELIKLIGAIHKEGIKVRLDVYGEGSMRNKLLGLIDRNGLNKVVRLKGYVDQDRMPTLLAKYNMFVRLSTQEGFGISFIEAMASGLITVGTDVGGIKDIIEHEKTGYLLDLKTSLINQMTELIRNKKKWSRIVLTARKKVEKEYSWVKIAPKIEKLYW